MKKYSKAQTSKCRNKKKKQIFVGKGLDKPWKWIICWRGVKLIPADWPVEDCCQFVHHLCRSWEWSDGLCLVKYVHGSRVLMTGLLWYTCCPVCCKVMAVRSLPCLSEWLWYYEECVFANLRCLLYFTTSTSILMLKVKSHLFVCQIGRFLKKKCL